MLTFGCFMHHVRVVGSRCTFFSYQLTFWKNEHFHEFKNLNWNKKMFHEWGTNVVLDPKDLDSMYEQKQLNHSTKYFNVNADRMFIVGWTIPLTSLHVPLQERPQSSQLAVQWSAWFLAGWKSASECESSSCGEGGERANCLGRISTLPLLRNEMKRGWCLILPT